MSARIGFIGLGNVGGKLAGSLLRNGCDLMVRDLDRQAAAPLLAGGAAWGESPRQMAQKCDIVITCLPNAAASAKVMEDPDEGLLLGLGAGKVWAEMSTTDEAEVHRLGELVAATGASPIDCPVSGGCHRAATGNIAIFAGGDRSTFETVLPVLATMGRRILHTGPLGSASVLKVVTNYLATANLLSLSEALVTAKAAGMDLNTTYEAIRISSGNSFVHETESQVILNGSRDINFTMDLVVKDMSLFQSLADRAELDLELAPAMLDIFLDGQDRFGAREWSPNIIRRLEEQCGLDILAPGFPAEIVDDEPEAPGHEIAPPPVAPADLIDRERYPIDEPGPRRSEVIDEVRAALAADGCAVIPEFLNPAGLAALLGEAQARSHLAFYPEVKEANVYLNDADPSLGSDHPRNRFMARTNGFVRSDAWDESTHSWRLYHWPALMEFLAECLGKDELHIYDDPVSNMILNVQAPGEEFNWHFDTNEFTITMLLQAPEVGGEFQYIPDLRSPSDERIDDVNAVLDGDRSQVRMLALEPGDLQFFLGRFALHRVAPNTGEDRKRLLLIMSFSEKPGAVGSVERIRRLYGKVTDMHRAAAAEPVRADALLD